MIENVENFNILTDDDEKQFRLNLCNTCVENIETETSGKICNQCACPIEYVVTYKFKICPLEKWSVE